MEEIDPNVGVFKHPIQLINIYCGKRKHGPLNFDVEIPEDHKQKAVAKLKIKNKTFEGEGKLYWLKIDQCA